MRMNEVISINADISGLSSRLLPIFVRKIVHSHPCRSKLRPSRALYAEIITSYG